MFFNGSIAEVFHVPGAVGDTSAAAIYSAGLASGGQAATETVTVADPGQHKLTYRYDLQNGGRILSQTDGTGMTTAYGYDTGGFMDSVDADDEFTTTTHDTRGNVLSKTTCQDLADNICSTSYYTYYLGSTTTDPRNDEVLTSSDGRSSSASDTTYQTAYAYSSLGEVLTKTSPPVSGYPSGMTTTSTYTTAATAAYGGGTTPAGLLASTATADGAVTSYSYYSDGDLAVQTSPLGQATLYTYDGLGDTLSQTVTYSTAADLHRPRPGRCQRTARAPTPRTTWQAPRRSTPTTPRAGC